MLRKVKFCDVCGTEEEYVPPCDECGKDMCYKCRQTHSIEYPHSVSCSGWGDGLYCVECDQKLRASETDARHSAYLRIQELRNEERRFYEDFRARSTVAEQAVAAHERPRTSRPGK